MRIFPTKLSYKLITSLTIILALVGAVAAFVHVSNQERQLLDGMIMGADQLSGSITSATWHAMLDDRRAVAYEIMQTIARKQGISRIRIYNKEGRVMFSTVKGDDAQVDKDAEACSMCHGSGQPLVRVDVPSRSRIYVGDDGTRKLAMITPIYNEASCSTADCHAHRPSQNVLGVLDVSFDLALVDSQIASVRQRVFLITLANLVIISVFIVFFTRRFVDLPFRRLIAGARSISEMDLDRLISERSSEELDELARSFDAMRIRLKDALGEVNTFTRSLESKVAERTAMLETAQRRLMKSDRLASLGQLSATVAHEINNPISGVLNLGMLMQRILRDDGIPPDRVAEFRRYLGQIVTETGRVGRIVQDLLAFSRRSKPHRSTVNLNSTITSTMNLIGHKLTLMKVGTELALDPALPAVDCDTSQIQQVLVNLIINGAEAAQGKPGAVVRVSTGLDPDGGGIVLTVKDNGEGITQEHIAKIFDPFFTTKGESKGTGLGLAVVYGIVEEHRGEIDVESAVGEGTTFTVHLPLSDATRNGTPVPVHPPDAV
jgi:two-component system NtrC family sensor kinase